MKSTKLMKRRWKETILLALLALVCAHTGGVQAQDAWKPAKG
ncbi:MAG: hypothetical protein JWN98_1180, partial [Abditibacteriota bacterium]|nr:hypothetical protein [Abditibacteriota bacterium]